MEKKPKLTPAQKAEIAAHKSSYKQSFNTQNFQDARSALIHNFLSSQAPDWGSITFLIIE